MVNYSTNKHQKAMQNKMGNLFLALPLLERGFLGASSEMMGFIMQLYAV